MAHDHDHDHDHEYTLLMPATAAAILAGGLATRMGGRPKSFIEVGGRRIIDRQLEVLRPLFDEILIAANDASPYQEFGLPIVPDAVRGVGPLAGILAALEAMRAERIVAVACDMPFITEAALRLFLDAPDADVVVSETGGRPDPLFARYSRACAAPIRRRLEAGDRKVTSFFQDVSVLVMNEGRLREIDPELRFLANCNSPADLV
jgi:molybdopterin-guanine dinucleotide biosynthesis protein A